MRNWKPSKPLKIKSALREILKLRKTKEPVEKTVEEPVDEEFTEMMERAFPRYRRGSISGCCDSMNDGKPSRTED